jgi:hypothetical protein
VTVQAGDGQQAEPGITLPVKPAVLVADASGRPVAGVSVGFAVDSGGGSLTATAGTTGSNGVATAGDWKLGSAEGRNTVLATAGSLAPVKIVATATVTGTSLPPASIPAAGGSYVVTQAGPLNGFRIDVPAGAFTTSFDAAVSYASNATLPRNPGVNPLSPLITISTGTTDFAAKPFQIHIAADVPADIIPDIVAYDPTNGATQTLVTISWDAHGITAATSSLSATNMVSSASARLRAGAAPPAGGGVTLYVNGLPTNILMADYDSGFRPGTDDWDFPSTSTEVALNEVGAGSTVTSLWYYTTKASPQKLNGRFQDAASVPVSDRLGLRWTSVVGSQLDATVVNQVDAALQAEFGNLAPFDQNVFNSIRANFAQAALKGLTPTPELISIQSLLGKFTALLLVYRCQGDKLYVADPIFPGDATKFLQFPAGQQMSIYGPSPRNLSEGGYRFPYTFPLGLLIPPPQLAAQYQQVVAKTIGDDKFPAHEFHTWNARLFDTLYVVDTLRFWSECAACKGAYATTLSPTPGQVESGVIYTPPPPGWTSLGSLGANGLLVNAAGRTPGAVSTFGFEDVSGVGTQDLVSAGGKWLDWHRFSVLVLPASISPAKLTQAPTIPMSMKFETTPAQLPPHVKYRWDFGDAKPKVTVDDNPNVQHVWDLVGTYPVTAEIVDVRNDQVIARAQATATIKPQRPAWRLNTFTLQSSTGPAPDPLFDDAQSFRDLLTQLEGTPDQGMIFVLDQSYVGPPANVFVNYFPIVHLQVAPTNITDIFIDSQGFIAWAGFEIAGQCTPSFAALPQSGCGLSSFSNTGNLQAGSLAGSIVGTSGGFPPFPTVILQINGVKNGATMSGTIKLVDNLHGQTGPSTGTRTDTWAFTATLEP